MIKKRTQEQETVHSKSPTETCRSLFSQKTVKLTHGAVHQHTDHAGRTASPAGSSRDIRSHLRCQRALEQLNQGAAQADAASCPVSVLLLKTTTIKSVGLGLSVPPACSFLIFGERKFRVTTEGDRWGWRSHRRSTSVSSCLPKVHAGCAAC